jgi:predicted HTH transcriptional regulator
MTAKLNKADGTIKQHLDKLKKAGILTRVGSNKSGVWQVNEKYNHEKK